MKKLIAGEKVKQLFDVTIRFKATGGDKTITKNDILSRFAGLVSSGGTPISVAVKEVRDY